MTIPRASIAAAIVHCDSISSPARNAKNCTRKRLSAETVYRIDHSQVSRSDFLVFHAIQPSFGAGQELEIATSAGLPVLLLWPRGVSVSRMVLGTYARLKTLEFSTPDELRAGLSTKLSDVVHDLVVRRDYPGAAPDLLQGVTHGSKNDLGNRIRSYREAIGGGLDTHTLARLIGLSEFAVQQLENGNYPNPSLLTLRRLAMALRTSVSELVDGIPRQLEDYDPVLRKSRDNLLQFASEDRIPHDDVQSLWDAHSSAYRKQRLNVADARTEPVEPKEWRNIYQTKKRGASSSPKQAALFNDD